MEGDRKRRANTFLGLGSDLEFGAKENKHPSSCVATVQILRGESASQPSCIHYGWHRLFEGPVQMLRGKFFGQTCRDKNFHDLY